MTKEIKRLFFGWEIHAPWQEENLSGRLLKINERHMTLAFLGNIPVEKISFLLPSFPRPIFTLGNVGIFNRCLLLPKKHPNVIAWNMHFLGDSSSLYTYQKEIVQWLKINDFNIDEREWLPHVTLARKPFITQEWIQSFVPLPFYTSSLHLYESKGNLSYEPIWSMPVQKPFEELDHTADIAFKILGHSLQNIYHHAFIALAFKEPHLIDYFEENASIESLEDIIFTLNHCIAFTDSEKRCCLKAVSYHGEITKNENEILEWEMIVDV